MDIPDSCEMTQLPKPEITQINQGITVWNMKSLAAVPETAGTLRIPDKPRDDSDDLLARQTYGSYMG
jgi:hypothetical protein